MLEILGIEFTFSLQLVDVILRLILIKSDCLKIHKCHTIFGYNRLGLLQPDFGKSVKSVSIMHLVLVQNDFKKSF